MVHKIRRSLIASVAAAALLLSACSNSEGEGTSSSASSAAAGDSTATAAAGELKIEDNFGEKTVTLPVERAAVTDNRAFEILSDWDVNIVAAPKKIIPASLRDRYADVEVDLGNHREPDLEALVATDPDLVWNGQRFEQHQEDIEKLLDGVPVLDFEPRDDKDFSSELKRHATALGEVFEHEADAEALIAEFDAAVERAKKAYDPSKKVMAVNTSGGEIGYIAPGIGRTYGPLFDLIGMTPALEVANSSEDHEGDDISVEAIAESNPDWILVMDRDGAVASEEDGYTPGGDLVKNNAALQNVTAVKEGQVYVAPADTYTNESIITYTEILNAMADAFEAQK
ncbi:MULTISPECIES: siderophore ABC transporter substrate-binding protein [Corynebacterium]|uniref:siderophore ABC transporter substrate-binding protein n=1 Tax=Corynebacterium TaxID=1716 RepID=UPI00257D173C|nr:MULTISPECIES: ABC transporter substrate-binding protein [Corynebacterium]MDN6100374.1 ABC transporter substrate-binding protein [Corynebacterium flavescens]MDN6200455.1 ABC transporter substrate-binding protein [Corynebacterium flavescens]MDN6225946.1 ABC transporter substrate-binding protein [Corynebacterium flavescens]MDN6235992.1 ABC transporter substrate-binding protein [Corynebacterium flavescens]MDN6432105.1 ABC transporter substrate-binding protein [Corynebacterium flavescens]